MVTDVAERVLAVDPVPWARSQMAFTLAFHIILVPLGVSWAAMTLIANYRGIKHDDPDAMLLAQRWSKYMAVTFAVGAVTGTVLSLRVRAAVAEVHGPVGRGVRGAVRVRGDLLLHRGGLHLDLHLRVAAAEAVGPLLDRGARSRWPGIFGSISVVAANAWMNSPQGVTLDSAGQGRRRRPDGGDLQRRDAADGRAHGGRGLPGRRLPDRLGLRRRACCAAAATATTGSASSSRSPWRRSPRRCRWASATRWRGGSSTTSRPSSPRSRWSPRPAATCPRCCSGTSTPTARSVGGHPDPGPGLDPVRPERPGRPPSSRGSTRCPPTTGRPSREVNVTHLAWDVMVGLGTLLFLLTLWYWATWIFRRDMPRSRWFLRAAAACRGARRWSPWRPGWTVSEVGRQPWIVYEKMKVEDAATANTGDLDHLRRRRRSSTSASAITTILVLRLMSRRFRQRRSGVDESDVPYGPSEPTRCRTEDERRCRSDEHRRGRHPVRRRHDLRDLRWRRLRRRLLGPGRRRHRARRTAPRGDRPLDRPGLGGEPRLADLRASSCCGPASRRPTPRSR